LSLLSGPAFSGAVATFTDANSFATTADFTATIDWGDATPSTSGTIAGSGSGPYTVSGSHTYTSFGFFTIKIHIVDNGGSTADATTTILIFGTSTGGNFVIGDGNAAVSTNVTFWGAQWSKKNTLSAGSAPAAFKGFENSPSTLPACGTSWSTGPGNSPKPPAGPLPSFMAVLVSSSISQSGSTITGNTPHIVIVQTNPGYAANPGHAGTGTVVAVLCRHLDRKRAPPQSGALFHSTLISCKPAPETEPRGRLDAITPERGSFTLIEKFLDQRGVPQRGGGRRTFLARQSRLM
jgi:hypothetical protein